MSIQILTTNEIALCYVSRASHRKQTTQGMRGETRQNCPADSPQVAAPHIAANELTTALIALRHLQDGKPVSPKLLERAIQDLEALMERVDRKSREGGR